MKHTKIFALVAILCSLFIAVNSKPWKGLYTSSRSYVVHLSKQNFDKVVTKNREMSVSIVHYYKRNGIILPAKQSILICLSFKMMDLSLLLENLMIKLMI